MWGRQGHPRVWVSEDSFRKLVHRTQISSCALTSWAIWWLTSDQIWGKAGSVQKETFEIKPINILNLQGEEQTSWVTRGLCKSHSSGKRSQDADYKALNLQGCCLAFHVLPIHITYGRKGVTTREGWRPAGWQVLSERIRIREHVTKAFVHWFQPARTNLITLSKMNKDINNLQRTKWYFLKSFNFLCISPMAHSNSPYTYIAIQ